MPLLDGDIAGAPSDGAGSGGQPALDGVPERDEEQGSLDLTSVMELANFVMCGAGAEGEDAVEAALGVGRHTHILYTPQNRLIPVNPCIRGFPSTHCMNVLCRCWIAVTYSMW